MMPRSPSDIALMTDAALGRPRVVVLGAGFGGMQAAHDLAGAPCDVVLIDSRNHHLFQPLLYQVATAGLAPSSIAWPIRSQFRGQKNIRILMAEATHIDLGQRRVHHEHGFEEFDYLIVATGVGNGWFGRQEWSAHAIGLKSLEDALAIRNRALECYERAEAMEACEEQSALLRFVVIGGGPTGVEMAGSLAELGRRCLQRDFDRIQPELAKVILIEAGDRILASFDRSLSQRAESDLRELGVEVLLGTKVTDITAGKVTTDKETIFAETIVWAAGVEGGTILRSLGVPLDRQGRVIVTDRCEAPGERDVFVIGDAARFETDGKPLPGVASVALQQATYAVSAIRARIAGRSDPPPFAYQDPGSMATIGRTKAIVEKGRFRMAGSLAWLAWLFVHLIRIMSFRRRIAIFVEWMASYLTWQRGSRLITGPPTQLESEIGERTHPPGV